MTDVDGSIVWQETYKAWGEVEALTVSNVEQNLRFQGQYFGDETRLHYNTFRYYDPQVGRFITQDPIGLGGGVNLYEYASNPVDGIDPLRLSCESRKESYAETEKGSLPSWVTESFTCGKYKAINAKPGGAFVSAAPASSRMQAKLDAALLPEWKNIRQFEAKILIPKGTTLNV